jgi:ABC-2 type transport system permease protein
MRKHNMDNNNSQQNDKKKYSQFRAMMALAVASFRSTLRSPSAVIFTLAFPLIFVVVFGFIGGGGFKMDVAVDHNIDKDNPVYKALVSNPSIHIIDNQSEEETIKELERGNASAWLNIQNASQQGKPHYIIILKTSKAAADKAIMFKMVVNAIVDKINLSVIPVPEHVAEIKSSEIAGRKYTMIDFILPGQLGFSLLSTGVFGTAFVFFSLRQTLVLKRFFATPVKRSYIILAESLSRLVFALLGALFLIVIGYYVFNFTLLHGVVTALNLLVLSAIGLIVFMGFGFIISGIAKSDNTIPPLANIITMPQFLLSGTFFSITLFPPWLQNISKILPLTYLNDALRKVSFEGASLMDVGKEISILLIWGVVIYFVASKTFKWE